jgi:hypothetical protein
MRLFFTHHAKSEYKSSGFISESSAGTAAEQQQ